MYLKDWTHKWLVAVITCLFILMGCGASMLWHHYEVEMKKGSKVVINQVRLQVNAMMLLLSQYHGEISADPKLQKTLQDMAQDEHVSLVYVGLDGAVQFHSSADDTRKHIDVHTALHYDLYDAKANKDFYNIAFPVVDEATKTQVGNAIFTIPAGMIFDRNSLSIPLSLFIIMTLLLLILFFLMFLLRKKIKGDIIQPIYHLKDDSEAILKGNYEQRMTYAKMDEIGEVYAMFDLMRMEIMHHSLRRDEQEQAQKELISNISHELKTPLTTLTSYIEMLREGSFSDMSKVIEYIEVMHTNTDKLTRLTEDLLLHALKELGQISVTLTEQYSKEVLSRILHPIGHYVRSTGVTFTEPAHIPNVLIYVDAHRLEQVISNLISNAMKHTSAGDSIHVDIVLERGHLKITIADTGKGILPQDIPFVFERYFKGKSNINSASGGTGLGLSICKHIIEAHHGSISFKSTPDQGTVFYCLIPVG